MSVVAVPGTPLPRSAPEATRLLAKGPWLLAKGPWDGPVTMVLAYP